MSRRLRWTGRLLVLCLLLPGCKGEEKLPEHELQQREKQRERERLRKEREREAKEQLKGRDASVDHYAMWSPEVRQAFYALYRSRSMGIPEKARTLAQYGLEAADALRVIAASRSQSAKKKALVSFMLVDMHMFRVNDLAKLAREHQLIFVQRAAIEALARVGNPQSEAALDVLAKELPKMPVPVVPDDDEGHSHGYGHGPSPMAKDEPPPDIPPDQHPLVRWTRNVRRKLKGQRWAYSTEQLQTLDRVFQADNPQKLRLSINAVKDATKLERGLRAILRSPVTRASVQAGVSFKLVEPYLKDSKALRRLCTPQEHQLVRMQAARALLELGRAADRAFVGKLAEEPRDPLASVFQRMLKQVTARKGKDAKKAN